MAQAGTAPAEVILMNPHAFLPRSWNRSHGASDAPTSLRFEVRPPSLRHAPDSFWQRLWFWLAAPAPGQISPPIGRLPRVREDFITALHDLEGDDAGMLRRRIQHSHSLRELWHLRADVFRNVATQRSQAEAVERLAGLNRHFPTRAPRSGFAPL
jgi:hypothetical protein